MKALSPSRVGWSALVLLCLSLALSSMTPAGEASGAERAPGSWTSPCWSLPTIQSTAGHLSLRSNQPLSPDRSARPLQQRHHHHRREHRHPVRFARSRSGSPGDGQDHARTRAGLAIPGEACVIDVRPLLDDAPIGHSPLIRKQHVLDWEQQHRPLGPGDVVLFRSGYNDKYFKPLPEGRGFVPRSLQVRKRLGPRPRPRPWTTWEAGVLTAGIDSPSMGPLPPPGEWKPTARA